MQQSRPNLIRSQQTCVRCPHQSNHPRSTSQVGLGPWGTALWVPQLLRGQRGSPRNPEPSSQLLPGLPDLPSKICIHLPSAVQTCACRLRRHVLRTQNRGQFFADGGGRLFTFPSIVPSFCARPQVTFLARRRRQKVARLGDKRKQKVNHHEWQTDMAWLHSLRISTVSFLSLA
jgi:hypothetical protein